MENHEIKIQTTDETLAKDLEQIDIENVTVKAYSNFREAVGAEDFIWFIVTISTNVACSLFATWLYDRTKSRTSNKTTIDGNNVQKTNITQIAALIENKSEIHIHIHVHTEKSEDSGKT